MGATVTQQRITVYDIPEGKVHFVLTWGVDRLTMSNMTLPPGLYLQDPVRSVAGPAMMHLTPVERTTTFHTVLVRVSDVERFARNFVPENPDPPVGDSSAQEIRESAIEARRLAEETKAANKERLRERVREAEKQLACNCDLDAWQPEPSTGHSHVCRIHKAAVGSG